MLTLRNLNGVLLMFVVCFFITTNQIINAQQRTTKTIFIKNEEKPDLSELFPEIPNCERKIEPISISSDGKNISQTAIYERNSFPCGSISLLFQPDLKRNRAEHYKQLIMPTLGTIQFKGYEAYQSSPLCGNDEWHGSIEVLFDKDKSLTVSAYQGVESIFQFAETIDYKQLKDTMNGIVKKHRNNKMKN